MSEETQTHEHQKNTIATVGMWFSIIGLILTIIIFFAWIWLPMLCVWFILWIIWLFSKPRGKARVAVIIPLVVFIALASIACYVWKSVKTPANEFKEWVEPQLEQLKGDDFDEDRFEKIFQSEVNKITNDKTDDDRKVMFEASTGSNFLEKGSYLFFSLIRESMETALEKYNSGELPEMDDEENDIIDVEIDVNDEEDVDEEDIDEEDNIEEDDIEDDNQKTEEPKAETSKKEKTGTFNKSEQNDIEQILNILE